MPLRILIVDDTVIYRKIISDALSEIPDVEVVGTANNGKIALSRIKTLKPDLMTLDIEMPEMNGIEVLEAVKKEALAVGAIMLSSFTVRGGDMTMKALELGAFDFITKPDGTSLEENKESIKKALVPLLKGYSRRLEIKTLLKGNKLPSAETAPANRPDVSALRSSVQRMGAIAAGQKTEVVVIGISTGGPNALTHVIPKFPADMNVPVLIVQHMPPLFTQSLAKSLDAKSAVTVKEAEDGEPVHNGTVYIAPGGKQMKVIAGTEAGKKIIRITDDPPENNCKPSVDYLFRSVSFQYAGCATGVIMTGMGNDGTLGLKLMKRSGCVTIAQDEATCVVFGMPKEALQAGVVDIVAPLDSITNEIMKTVRRDTYGKNCA